MLPKIKLALVLPDGTCITLSQDVASTSKTHTGTLVRMGLGVILNRFEKRDAACSCSPHLKAAGDHRSNCGSYKIKVDAPLELP